MPDAERLDAGKLQAIAEAQKSGRIDTFFTPFEVLTTVIAISMTWSPASTTFTAEKAEPTEDHDRRRAVLRLIVERAFPAGA